MRMIGRRADDQGGFTFMKMSKTFFFFFFAVFNTVGILTMATLKPPIKNKTLFFLFMSEN